MADQETNSSKDGLAKRQQSYQHTFEGAPGEAVLKDLAWFCRAEESCFHQDPRIHAVLEGRREVYLRIQQHLKLDLETLWQILGGPTHE